MRRPGRSSSRDVLAIRMWEPSRSGPIDGLPTYVQALKNHGNLGRLGGSRQTTDVGALRVSRTARSPRSWPRPRTAWGSPTWHPTCGGPTRPTCSPAGRDRAVPRAGCPPPRAPRVRSSTWSCRRRSLLAASVTTLIGFCLRTRFRSGSRLLPLVGRDLLLGGLSAANLRRKCKDTLLVERLTLSAPMLTAAHAQRHGRRGADIRQSPAIARFSRPSPSQRSVACAQCRHMPLCPLTTLRGLSFGPLRVRVQAGSAATS
jgi:hypothetical protein